MNTDSCRLMAVWTPSFPLSWNYTNAPAVLSLPGVVQYRQKKIAEPTPEQQACFLKHDPVGAMIPTRGEGLSLDEITERTKNYCGAMRLQFPGDIEEAIKEMVELNVVEEIRPK